MTYHDIVIFLEWKIKSLYLTDHKSMRKDSKYTGCRRRFTEKKKYWPSWLRSGPHSLVLCTTLASLKSKHLSLSPFLNLLERSRYYLCQLLISGVFVHLQPWGKLLFHVIFSCDWVSSLSIGLWNCPKLGFQGNLIFNSWFLDCKSHFFPGLILRLNCITWIAVFDFVLLWNCYWVSYGFDLFYGLAPN